MNRTAASGFTKGLDGVQKGNLMGESMASNEYQQPGRGRQMQQTIEAGEDQLSNDNVSAGGSRYVVGIKGGLKFYGPGESGANINDSISQGSAGAIS